MKLTKENIRQWKKEFDEAMQGYGVAAYSETEPDEHWLETYEGEDAKSAAIEETSNWQD